MAEAKILKCVDCGAEFEFSERDAVFYQEKGWEPPRRCKTCRVKKHPETRIRRRRKNGDKEELEVPETAASLATKYKINCASCGAESAVPFKPDPTRPVYCRTCLNKARAASRART